MIEFFRDTLDGPLYYVVLVIAIILIMAIIGYIIEKKQSEKKEQENIAVINNSTTETTITNNEPTIVPIAPVVETPVMEANPNSDKIDEGPIQQEQIPTIIDFGSTKDDDTNDII